MNPTAPTLLPPHAATQAARQVRARRAMTVPGHIALVNGSACSAAPVAKIVTAAIEHGVECLSLFPGGAAQTVEFVRTHGASFARNGVHLTAQDGSRAEFIELLASFQMPVAGETLLRLHLLTDVSGEMELARALQRLGKKVQRGELAPESLTREAFERELDADELPPVDLLLHTADAPRLSRTLPWKAAYAELFFSAIPWSQFGPEHFSAALQDYAQRRRTFGGLK